MVGANTKETYIPGATLERMVEIFNEDPSKALDFLSFYYQDLGTESLSEFRNGSYSSVANKGIRSQVETNWKQLPAEKKEKSDKFAFLRKREENSPESIDADDWKAEMQLQVSNHNTKEQIYPIFAAILAIPGIEANTIQWMGDLFEHIYDGGTISNFNNEPQALYGTVEAIKNVTGVDSILTGIPWREKKSSSNRTYDNVPIDKIIYQAVDGTLVRDMRGFIPKMTAIFDYTFNSPYGYLVTPLIGGVLRGMQTIVQINYQFLGIEGMITTGPIVKKSAGDVRKIKNRHETRIIPMGNDNENSMAGEMTAHLYNTLKKSAEDMSDIYNNSADSIKELNEDAVLDLRNQLNDAAIISVQNIEEPLMIAYALNTALRYHNGTNPRYLDYFNQVANQIPQPAEVKLIQ
jgi:hypothetical protein